MFIRLIVTVVILLATYCSSLAAAKDRASQPRLRSGSKRQAKNSLASANAKGKSSGGKAKFASAGASNIFAHIFALANQTIPSSKALRTESVNQLNIAGVKILSGKASAKIKAKSVKKLADATFDRVELRLYGDYPANDPSNPRECRLRPYLVDSYPLGTAINSWYDGSYVFTLAYLSGTADEGFFSVTVATVFGNVEMRQFNEGDPILFSVPWVYDPTAADQDPKPECSEYGLDQNYVIKAMLKNTFPEPKSNELGICYFPTQADCASFTYADGKVTNPQYCRTFPGTMPLDRNVTQFITGIVEPYNGFNLYNATSGTGRSNYTAIASVDCSTLSAADGYVIINIDNGNPSEQYYSQCGSIHPNAGDGGPQHADSAYYYGNSNLVSNMTVYPYAGYRVNGLPVSGYTRVTCNIAFG